MEQKEECVIDTIITTMIDDVEDWSNQYDPWSNPTSTPANQREGQFETANL
jgi:hypothetical protein